MRTLRRYWKIPGSRLKTLKKKKNPIPFRVLEEEKKLSTCKTGVKKVTILVTIMGVPVVAQWVTNPRMQVQSLALIRSWNLVLP